MPAPEHAEAALPTGVVAAGVVATRDERFLDSASATPATSSAAQTAAVRVIAREFVILVFSR
jgi:hypothetical protein